MDLTDAKAVSAFNWTLRAMRGGLAGLAALTLCSAQKHFTYPAWQMAFAFFAFSMIDRVWRYATWGLCFLLLLALLPPQLFSRFGAWIERLLI